MCLWMLVINDLISAISINNLIVISTNKNDIILFQNSLKREENKENIVTEYSPLEIKSLSLLIYFIFIIWKLQISFPY